MMHSFPRLLLTGVSGVLLLCFVTTLSDSSAQQRPVLRRVTALELPQSTGVIRLEFGLTAPQSRRWEGSIHTSAGEILSTWGWHFRDLDTDRVVGNNGWTLMTHLHDDPALAYSPTLPLSVPIMPNGVNCAIKAPDSAELTVKTNRGEVSFRLSELQARGRLTFFEADVAAVYSPTIRPLTRGAASQHDFPSVTAVGDEVFAAWVTFHNERNFVYMAQRKQGTWITHKVAELWGDYYGSAIAAEGSDKAVVIWSEYEDERWRLVSRTFHLTTGRLGAPQYVAPGGRRQYFHHMTTDSNGAPWLVWQEFADGNFEIFAARRASGKWSEPITISESPANDWNPAIAAGSDGAVYVAWDSYRRGNYDIFLRTVRAGSRGPVVQVTRAETYDAYPSIAVDPQNGVWLAWEEARPNWGKDFGVIVKKGSRLHDSRRLRVVRYKDGKFSEPATPLEKTLPGWLREMNEYAHLTIGANGLPYLFFRHEIPPVTPVTSRTERRIGSKVTINNPWYEIVRHFSTINVTSFDGKSWQPVRELPHSEGRCHMQSGSVLVGDKLLYLWPSDGRTFSDPHVRTAQLQYVELETNRRPAAADGMKPFQSEPIGVADAAPTEERDVERVRAVRWQDRAPLRLFRGDLHRHTDISMDGGFDGDIVDNYRYAIDVAKLDFLAITDHTIHETQNYARYDWWRSRQTATMFNNPGHFVAFFAYERTVGYPGGHRNIISTRRGAQQFRVSDEEYSGVELYSDRLFPYLRANGDISIPHTTGSGGGTDWSGVNDPRVEPVLEIFQSMRGSYEEPNGPAKANINRPNGVAWKAWAKGARLGVIASSDHQSTHQSYACVYAEELTAKSIHNGLKMRRTYGATDNIIVKFQAVTDAGNVYKMGQELVTDSSPVLAVEIHGTANLAKVDLIANGKILLSRSPESATDKFTYRDLDAAEGARYYYLRVVQKDKQIAWSSPIWADYR